MLLGGFCCAGGSLGGVEPVSPPPVSSFTLLGLLRTGGEGLEMAGLESDWVVLRRGLLAEGFTAGALASGGWGTNGFWGVLCRSSGLSPLLDGALENLLTSGLLLFGS